MFDTLQDRLSATFRSLRGKGRLSESDVNEALREIRLALLEADVNLGVVKEFIAACREKLTGAELSAALNPTQQIVKGLVLLLAVAFDVWNKRRAAAAKS